MKTKVKFFLIIFLISIISILYASLTGNQIVELPMYNPTTVVECSIIAEIKDYSPEKILFKNPLITGLVTKNNCYNSGPYHIKVNNKLYPKFSCTREDVITYRSCTPGEVLMHGVLTKINLTNSNFVDGYYQGSWRCAKGQKCVVEKRMGVLFRGCEGVTKEKKEPIKSPVLEQSCNLEITYVDYKTRILVKDVPGKKELYIKFGERGKKMVNLLLKEKEPGVYSRTLIFRKPKEYEFKYKNQVLPLKVIPAPKELQEKEIKKIYKKVLDNIKEFLIKIIY